MLQAVLPGDFDRTFENISFHAMAWGASASDGVGSSQSVTEHELNANAGRRADIGAVEKDGRVAHGDHKLLRETALNVGIGQKRQRFEKSFRTDKFKRNDQGPDPPSRSPSRSSA